MREERRGRKGGRKDEGSEGRSKVGGNEWEGRRGKREEGGKETELRVYNTTKLAHCQKKPMHRMKLS